MVFHPCCFLLTVLNTPTSVKQLCTWFDMMFIILLCVAFTMNWFNVVQRLLSMVCLPFNILHGIENLSKVLLFILVAPGFRSSEVLAEDEKHPSDSRNQQCCSEETDDGNWNIHRGDVEMVMRHLGFSCSPEEGGKLKELISPDELSQLFEEMEPSLEEVKEAFDVFDKNKDGFIDAEELQRVLCLLGLKGGIDLKNCRNMIRTFDQNGDNKIDISEFIWFMKKSFC